MAGEIRITYLASLEQLQGALEKGEISARQFSKSIEELAKAEKLRAKATADAAKKDKEADAAFDKRFRGFEKLGQVLGGTAGETTGALGDLRDVVDGLGMGASAAALGVGVFVAGVTATAAAGYTAAESAAGLREQLEGIAGAPPLRSDLSEAIDRYERASDASTESSTRLQASLGALATVAVLPLVEAFDGLTRALIDLVPSVETYTEITEAAGIATRATVAAATLGVSEFVRLAYSYHNLAGASQEAQAALEGAQRATGPTFFGLAKAIQDEAKESERLTGLILYEDDRRQAAAAKARQAAEAAARAREAELQAEIRLGEQAASANEKLAQIARDAASDTLTAEEQITQAHADRLEQIRELASVASDTSAVSTAVAESEARMLRELAEERASQAQDVEAAFSGLIDVAKQLQEQIDGMNAERFEATLQKIASVAQEVGSIVGKQTAALQTLFDLQIQSAEDRASTIKANRDKEIAALNAQTEIERQRIESDMEAGRISRAMGEAELAALEESQAAQIKERTKFYNAKLKIQRQEALQAFEISQHMARAQLIMETAVAIAALSAGMAYLGPAAPAAAAAVMAVPFAAGMASIEAQKPPEFPMGFSPDHSTIGVFQPGEAGLSRRGVAAAGGPRAVEALNQGRSDVSMGGSTTIALTYGASTLERVFVDASRRPGVAGALRRATGTSRAMAGRRTR